MILDDAWNSRGVEEIFEIPIDFSNSAVKSPHLNDSSNCTVEIQTEKDDRLEVVVYEFIPQAVSVFSPVHLFEACCCSAGTRNTSSAVVRGSSTSVRQRDQARYTFGEEGPARDERRRNAGQSAWGSLEGPEARLGGGKAFSHRSSRFSQRTAPSAGVPSEKHAPVVTECSEGHREDS